MIFVSVWLAIGCVVIFSKDNKAVFDRLNKEPMPPACLIPAAVAAIILGVVFWPSILWQRLHRKWRDRP